MTECGQYRQAPDLAITVHVGSPDDITVSRRALGA
jgi:hypothetical protein